MVQLVRPSSTEVLHRSSSEVVNKTPSKDRSRTNSAISINRLSKSAYSIPKFTLEELNGSSLINENRFFISITKGTSGLTSPVNTKFKICDGKENVVYSVTDVNQSLANSVKILAVQAYDGNEIMRISYRMGLQTLELFEANGERIGQCTSKFKAGWCLPIWNRIPTGVYKLRINDKCVAEVEGYISLFGMKPKKKYLMTIKTKNPSETIGFIIMRWQNHSYTCALKFLDRKTSFEERQNIVGMCIGFLDYSYEKHLASTYKVS